MSGGRKEIASLDAPLTEVATLDWRGGQVEIVGARRSRRRIEKKK